MTEYYTFYSLHTTQHTLQQHATDVIHIIHQAVDDSFSANNTEQYQFFITIAKKK